MSSIVPDLMAILWSITYFCAKPAFFGWEILYKTQFVCISLCLSVCMSQSQGILVHKSIDSLILSRLFWLIFLSYPSKEGPRKGDYLSHHQMASLQLNLAFLPPSKRLGMSPWRRQPAYPSRMSLILIKGFKSRLQSHWKKFKIYVYQCKFIIFVIEICRFYSTKWNIISSYIQTSSKLTLHKWTVQYSATVP